MVLDLQVILHPPPESRIRFAFFDVTFEAACARPAHKVALVEAWRGFASRQTIGQRRAQLRRGDANTKVVVVAAVVVVSFDFSLVLVEEQATTVAIITSAKRVLIKFIVIKFRG